MPSLKFWNYNCQISSLIGVVEGFFQCSPQTAIVIARRDRDGTSKHPLYSLPYVSDTSPTLIIRSGGGRSLLAAIMDNLVLKVAEFSTDFPDIQRIRYTVFQVEQGVTADLEFDGKDADADHLLAYLDGQPVGTARIRRLDAQTAKVERVAVLKAARGFGIGKTLMVEALAFLAKANVLEVQIHAQEAVQDFYQRLGFEPEGEIFVEAGIRHVKMKLLTSQTGR